MKPSTIILGLLKIPVDFIMGLLAFIVAYQLRAISDFIPGITLALNLETFPPLIDHINYSAITVLVLILLMALRRMYLLKIQANLSKEISNIFITSIIWLALIMAYFFIIRDFPFSRLALLYSWLFTFIFISVGRLGIHLVAYILHRANIGRHNLLFIGINPTTETLIKQLSKNHHYHIVGAIDHNSSTNKLGTIKELLAIIKKHYIDEVIQTTTKLPHTESSDILEHCREHHVHYSFVPDLLSMQQTNIEVSTCGNIPIIKLKPTPLDGWGRVLKRGFDIIGASIGLIIFSPILLITTIAIKLDSKGTVFFKYLDDGSRVKRVGQHGKLFHFYKFRTMYPGTHNLRYNKLAHQDTRKGSPLVKIKNDPRVTKVGKFLRRTSIDELPQLINVLKGEMSLVGPRPHLPEEVAKYQKHHKFVLTIKPGITGLAQISGRSDLNFEQEVKLDTYYIEHWSIWLDLTIIFKTFGAFVQSYNE